MDFHGYVKCYVFWKGESVENTMRLHYRGNQGVTLFGALRLTPAQLDFALLRRELEGKFNHYVFNGQA